MKKQVLMHQRTHGSPKTCTHALTGALIDFDKHQGRNTRYTQRVSEKLFVVIGNKHDTRRVSAIFIAVCFNVKHLCTQCLITGKKSNAVSYLSALFQYPCLILFSFTHGLSLLYIRVLMNKIDKIEIQKIKLYVHIYTHVRVMRARAAV